MHERRLTSLDRLIAGINDALQTIAVPASRSSRPNPAEGIDDATLDARQRTHAAGLMRVNHAGEMAAQGLYQGHAAVARDEAVSDQMQHAAEEEFDHLAWCEQRLTELDSGPSKLNPLWYAGSFAIGAASGLFGDKWSLGFIAETEKQVCEHLTGHLHRLPEDDARSRAIVEQMRDEEQQHGDKANAAGAADLPRPVKDLMRLTSKVMTKTAYRI
ncbi:MAG: 2-polyprenyl-3-methyl-6-methoxy-1,4-benzoquinone monooxygenase [Woeseiaceae bacterium]